MNMEIVLIATVIIGLVSLYVLKKNAVLNAFRLDKKTAMILGIEVEKEQKKTAMGYCFTDFVNDCFSWTHDVFWLYDV